MRKIDTLVIHHSACLSGSVAQFRLEHRNRGWQDIGYHAVIGNGHGTEDGVIAQGRADAVEGAGVFGANAGKLHVCLVGNFERRDPGYTGTPTAAQFHSLGQWLLAKGKAHRVVASRVVGHREVTIRGHGTLCPGSNFPIELVRRWYSLCQHTGHPATVSLDDFLRTSGFKMSADEAKQSLPTTGGESTAVVATALSSQVVRCAALLEKTPGGEFDEHPICDEVIFKDGWGYVPLRALTSALGWDAPTYDSDKKAIFIKPL